jgi:hypothetical protein
MPKVKKKDSGKNTEGEATVETATTSSAKNEVFVSEPTSSFDPTLPESKQRWLRK